MKRLILIALLGIFASGCFSPNIKVGGEKPLVEIKHGGKDKKDKDDD